MTEAASNAPFGLLWGARQADVRSRFSSIKPTMSAQHALVYRLASVAEMIWAQGAFCPSVLTCDPERIGDELVFDFADDQLTAVVAQFGYGFQRIGQDPDTLSEHAMSSFARAEMHKLISVLATRYGLPVVLSENPNRSAVLHVQGTALFIGEAGSVIQLVFGHDGGTCLAGELRYRAPCPDRQGF